MPLYRSMEQGVFAYFKGVFPKANYGNNDYCYYRWDYLLFFCFYAI